MRPTQFDTQCVSNFRLGWIRLVEQAAIPQMRLTKPVAEFGRQLAGYSLQQSFAVCCALAPLLLLHDDSPPDQPVRERHRGIDVANDTPPRKDNDIPYVADAVPRHRHRRRNFGQLCLLSFHNIYCVLYHNLRRAAVDAMRPRVAADRFGLGPRAKRTPTGFRSQYHSDLSVSLAFNILIKRFPRSPSQSSFSDLSATNITLEPTMR